MMCITYIILLSSLYTKRKIKTTNRFELYINSFQHCMQKKEKERIIANPPIIQNRFRFVSSSAFSFHFWCHTSLFKFIFLLFVWLWWTKDGHIISLLLCILYYTVEKEFRWSNWFVSLNLKMRLRLNNNRKTCSWGWITNGKNTSDSVRKKQMGWRQWSLIRDTIIR